MNCLPELQRVEARPLAIVRARCSAEEFSAAIPEAFDRLYAELRKHRVASSGGNVVVYSDCVFNLEVGVVVPADFVPVGALERSDTPSGQVAALVHVGAYSGLPAAHRQIQAWCAEQGQSIGTGWEVYGDWSDDPAQLRTEIFYLVV